MITMTIRCARRVEQEGGGPPVPCSAKLVGPRTFGYLEASRATVQALRSQGWSVQDVSLGGTIRAAYCPKHQ